MTADPNDETARRFSRRSAVAATALGVAATTIGAARASAQATPVVTPGDWGWLDQAVSDGMNAFGIVGTAVAVVSKAGVLHTITAGARDQATQQPVTEQTLFAVASTTKSMTSLMVATYVDEGAFDWDQPVREVWPDFLAPSDELTQTMRVRDLLGMDSGIGEPVAVSMHQGEPTAPELVRSMAALPVDHPPQTTYFYNNSVYAVGGYLPFLQHSGEEQLETSYATAMTERVFGPVGMATARLTDDPRPFTDDYAVGNELDFVHGLVTQPWALVGSFGPVGAVYASLDDMTNYLRMQLGGGVAVSGKRIVTSENLKECWKPHIDVPIAKVVDPDLVNAGYGMGWLTQTYSDGRTLTWHSGGIDGFITYMGFFEADDLGLIVLTNNGPSAHGLYFYPYLINALLSNLFGLNAGVSQTIVDLANEADKQLQTTIEQTTAVNKDAVGRYLGYYQRGYVLSFDDDDALWLHLGRRAFRIMAMPDGDYVIASGLIAGTPLTLSTDANGDAWMAVTGNDETVRWLQGL